jgi:eukaryotic-like serine/threonine-protein kinase
VNLLLAAGALLLFALPAWLAGQSEDTLPPQADMVYVENFYIDVYEYPNIKGSLPAVDVSWEEAQALCQKRGKRLCTETEWQRACAGSQNYAYGYGPAFESARCNTPYLEAEVWKRDRGTAPSGAFPGCVSECGAHDMIGNVWEWTADRFSATEDWRVVRGGSWYHNANLARADTRYGRFLAPDYRLDLIGFRCCRSVSGPETPPK